MRLNAGEEVEHPPGTIFENRDQSSPQYHVKMQAFHVGSRSYWCAKEMETYQVSIAVSTAFEIATSCNYLIDLTAPWKVAKDPAQAEHLDAVLYHLAESLRIIAILISPVLPKAAAGIFAQLNWDKDADGNPRPFRLEDAKWGGLPDGHVLGTPTPLFPRIETTPPA